MAAAISTATVRERPTTPLAGRSLTLAVLGLGRPKAPTAKTAIQRQIDATDQQIDRLVYDLYGLTDEEIAIVEETTQ